MKYLCTTILLITLIFSCDKTANFTIRKEKNYHLTDQKIEQVQQFLVANQDYDQEIVFLLDFELPSRKERFFVYHPNIDSITNRGLVTHGSCNGGTANINDVYSNTPNSYCSSLGKYKVGKAYQGKFGLAYKLHGLEQSNSNAFERFIVLHAHDCVPDKAVNYPICLSQGCPTVSPSFLELLASKIDASEQPILLWIWNDNG